MIIVIQSNARSPYQSDLEVYDALKEFDSAVNENIIFMIINLVFYIAGIIRFNVAFNRFSDKTTTVSNKR